jgi:hypothetical protein
MVEETSTAELEFLQRKCASMTPKLYCNRHANWNPNFGTGDLYLMPALRTHDEKKVPILKYSTAGELWEWIREWEKTNA